MSLRSDLRIAVRSLRRSWRFAAGVVLSLALAIGLGVPILSLADHFFLRAPAGVDRPDNVVRLVERGQGSRGPFFTDGLTGLDYTVITTRAVTLASVAGWVDRSLGLGRGIEARTVSVTAASASYFTVLGVRPFRGRFYNADEDVDGNPQPPCVISYRFWQTAMSAAEDAIGQRLLIGAQQYTVVGIAPQDFNGLSVDARDVWLPLFVVSPEFNGRDPLLWTTDHSSWLQLVARIKPGVSLAAANADVAHLYATSGTRQRDPQHRGTLFWEPLPAGRTSLSNLSARLSVWLSAGEVLLLLLVTASLVNLFIARALSQVRQTAVRLAIGGSWRQLLRLQLVETALLAVLAVGLGLAIAAPTTTISRSLIFPGVVWARPVLDVRGAAIGFGLACFVSTVTTFWNALYTMRVNPADLLRASASASTGTPRHTHAVRRTLVMVQASILVVLLSGTVAFVLSLRRASHADLGFDITALVAVRFPLPAETPPERVNALYREARDRVARVPGVESAALAYMEPWRNNANVDFSVPGATALEPPVTLFDLASPEYLHTFGIAMRSGRWFEQADNPSAAPVVVVNESFANNYWPRGDGLGQCLRVGGASAPCRTLVGIVRDFHVTGQLDGTIYPTIIVPVAQGTGFRQTPHLFIRVRGDRSTVMSSARRALQIMEPNLPALDVHPVENNASAFFASLKLGAAAFSAFGVLSAVIAALGLHSVLSLLIVERRRIYAIRLALGATPASLARAVGFYATATVVTGLLIGGAVLIPIARVIEPILFHTKLLAVASLVGVSTLAMIIAIGAVVGPVRTMFRTDVMTVLREQ